MTSSSTKVKDISLSEVARNTNRSEAAITNAQGLSSYNWIEARNPTITVPGAPPAWAPPGRRSTRVKQDSGTIFIAQNEARIPESPLEPLFRALLLTHPTFDLSSINLVTDRNNLRKLLSFVNPVHFAKEGQLEPFTIKVEVVAAAPPPSSPGVPASATRTTVLFGRHAEETVEHLGPRDFRGYGHEFEKAFTMNTIPGATGHHRVISYQFGGLTMLVRHEVDAYVAANEGADRDLGLAKMVSSLSLTPQTQGASSATSSRLIVKENLDQQSSSAPPASISTILEIKTRTSRKPIPIDEVLPQLWFAQTQHLVRAYHDRGVFETPRVEPISNAMCEWERRNAGELQLLAMLLQMITKTVTEDAFASSSVPAGQGAGPIGHYTVTYGGGQTLSITKATSSANKMLPDDIYVKWQESSAPAAA